VSIPLTGLHVLEQVEDINTIFGKTQKKMTSKTCIWKNKNSIHSTSTFSETLSPLPVIKKDFNGSQEHESAPILLTG